MGGSHTSSVHQPHGQHHHSGHGAHTGASSGGSGLNFLSPEHAASNLSVPDCDGSNPRLVRGSSLKFSRQRARSFGPSQRRKSAFQRSGSMDTPVQGDSDRAPGRLQGAKSDSLATSTSPASAISMAAATLAVAFGGQTPNVLTLQVPSSKPAPVPRPGQPDAQRVLPRQGHGQGPQTLVAQPASIPAGHFGASSDRGGPQGVGGGRSPVWKCMCLTAPLLAIRPPT